MFRSEDVVAIYKNLVRNGIRVWLTGGWGIDALLGQETRKHNDLDIIILVDDVVRMRDLLSQVGYTLKELWPENKWIRDLEGREIPTAFVLEDTDGIKIDAHAIRLDGNGNGIPAWETDWILLKAEDLAGEGEVAGVAVHCISAKLQILSHTGYELPHQQWRDLELLRERFGVQHPGSA